MPHNQEDMINLKVKINRAMYAALWILLLALAVLVTAGAILYSLFLLAFGSWMVPSPGAILIVLLLIGPTLAVLLLVVRHRPQ